MEQILRSNVFQADLDRAFKVCRGCYRIFNVCRGCYKEFYALMTWIIDLYVV